MDCSTPGFPVLHHLQSLLKLISIESVMPSNHLIFCHPLLLLPSAFPSIRVFSSESFLHSRCPKYWSFSFSISPSSEHSRLISFRIDWFDLLAFQGTLKESSPAPQFETISSAAFSLLDGLTSVYDYRNTIALTRQTSIGHVGLDPVFSILHAQLRFCLSSDVPLGEMISLFLERL